jgi:acetyltransferase-like isoleucine patch superfamily enzyme
MIHGRIFQKAVYRMRALVRDTVTAVARKPWWRLQGMTIGRGAVFASLTVNWPHKVAIGRACLFEPDVLFKFDGVWSAGRAIEIGDRVFLGRGTEFNIIDHIHVGEDALIGSGCKFIDHNHGIASGRLIGPQSLTRAPITIGRGVWLGDNVVVLQGVSIGEGAVIGAGAVVTRSVPANEIWGGVPARRIGCRSPTPRRGAETA